MSAPNKYLPVAAMPGIWQTWYRKVCHLLEVDALIPLNKQRLQHPWFLFPTQSELSDDEIQHLVAAIRTYLLPHKQTSGSDIRNRLLTLSPEASLPFLYLMRYVAYRSGGNRYYWPPFREMVFSNQLTYEDVAMRLAGATAELWMRLFRHTDGALYIPPFGPINIKWPLAHAGLLPEHKPILDEFGIAMLQAVDSEIDLFAETVQLGSDEFILRYQDWLHEHRQYDSALFSQLMRSTQPERYVIAELGQRWLSRRRQDLERELGTASHSRRQAILPRRRLAFRASDNQIGIRFSLGRLRIGQQAQLLWNNQKISLTYQDLREANRRFFLDEFLPVYGPTWPAEAKLHITPDLAKVISMPILEQGAVFDAVTGLQTTHWQMNQAYHVLVPGKALDKVDPTQLFAEWFDLGMPFGKWAEYRLLLVRTRMLEELSLAMEETAQELGLPSFEHHRRARLRLIGGELLAYDATGILIFATTSPPLLEVTGLRTADMILKLSCRQTLSGEYRLIDRYQRSALSSEHSASMNQIVELWTQHGEIGHYRVAVGDESIEFVLQERERALIHDSVAEFQLTICVEDRVGHQVDQPNRYELDEFYVVVNAWPAAELQLQLITTASGHSPTLSIQTDSKGKWRDTLAALPFPWDLFPSGDLTLRISWRGLFTKQLEIVDKTSISAGSLHCQTRPVGGGRYSFSCEGVVHGDTKEAGLFGYLLPETPWRKPARRFELHRTENEHFSGHTIVGWQPAWLLIGDGRLLNDGDSQLILVHSLSQNSAPEAHLSTVNLTNELREYESSWPKIASQIGAAAHPVGLRPYLALAPILRCLHTSLRKSKDNAWISITTWDEWERILPQIEAENPTAIFYRKVPAGYQAKPIKGVHITYSPNKHAAGKLEFSYKDAKLTASGDLVKAHFAGKNRIVLQPNSTLCVCPQCGLVVPEQMYRQHSAPFVDLPRHNPPSAAPLRFLPHKIDVSNYVAIAVLIDMRKRFEDVYNFLAEFHRSRRKPSQAYDGLLSKLRTLMPRGAMPDEWLGGLLRALETLAKIRRLHETASGRSVPFATLESMGRQLANYEIALEAVIDTVESSAVVTTEKNALPVVIDTQASNAILPRFDSSSPQVTDSNAAAENAQEHAVEAFLAAVSPYLAQQNWLSVHTWDKFLRIRPLIKQGVPTALFRKEVPIGRKTQKVAAVHIDFDSDSQRLSKVPFHFDSEPVTVRGHLVKAEDAGQQRIVLTADRTLQACLKCDVIISATEFTGHRAPFADIPDCSATKPEIHQYVVGRPDKHNCIAVGVLVTPQQMVAYIRHFLGELHDAQCKRSQGEEILLAYLSDLVPAHLTLDQWQGRMLGTLELLTNTWESGRHIQPTNAVRAGLRAVADELGTYEKALRAILEVQGAKFSPTKVAERATPNGILGKKHDIAHNERSGAVHNVREPVKQASIDSKGQVRVILEAHKVNLLDAAVAALIKNLEAEGVTALGPYTLPVWSSGTDKIHRRYLLVPLLAQWLRAIKHPALPMGVQLKVEQIAST